jgi:hypothetical protein
LVWSELVFKCIAIYAEVILKLKLQVHRVFITDTYNKSVLMQLQISNDVFCTFDSFGKS